MLNDREQFLKDLSEIVAFNSVEADRSAADAPDIDGKVFFMAGRRLKTGDYVTVQINDTIEYDLLGELI